MRTPLSPTVMISGRFNVSTRVNILRLIAGVLLSTVMASSGFAMVSKPAKKTADGSNLRQIGQASLIYAMDHADQLPRATDVWDYAAFLAKGAGLNSASMWQSKQDPFFEPNGSHAILSASGALNPDFRKTILAIAIPINANLSMSAPPRLPWHGPEASNPMALGQATALTKAKAATSISSEETCRFSDTWGQKAAVS